MNKESNRKTIYILSILVVLILGGLTLGYLNSDLFKAAMDNKEGKNKAAKGATCSFISPEKSVSIKCGETAYDIITENCKDNTLYLSRYIYKTTRDNTIEDPALRKVEQEILVDNQQLNGGRRLSSELNLTDNKISCDDKACYYANARTKFVNTKVNVCKGNGSGCKSKKEDSNNVYSYNMRVECPEECSYAYSIGDNSLDSSAETFTQTFYPISKCANMQTWISAGGGESPKLAQDSANSGLITYYTEDGDVELFKVPASADDPSNAIENAVRSGPTTENTWAENAYTSKETIDPSLDPLFKKICEGQIWTESKTYRYQINVCGYDTRFGRSANEAMRNTEICNSEHPEFLGEKQGSIDCLFVNGVTNPVPAPITTTPSTTLTNTPVQ